MAKKAACIAGRKVPNVPLTPREQIERFGTQACTVPYETITKTVIGRCSNWDGRLNDLDLLESARKRLIQAGIFEANEFDGVTIRWCPLWGAHGIAPDRGKVYLDVSLSDESVTNIAAVLAHEMKHIRQYRARGTDRFKCEYSRKYLECGGCQDRRHSLEREAYEFEYRAKEILTHGRQIFVRNKCSEKIELAVRFRDPSGLWETDGWWKFDPRESAYLASDGSRIRSDNSTFYYYAKLPRRAEELALKGRHKRKLGGQTLPMRLKKVRSKKDDNWILSIFCDDLPKVRKFYLSNTCHETIKFALRYRSVSGEWKTDGWWEFDPGQISYLTSSGIQIKSDNSIFYFYAEIPGRDYVWTGNYDRELGNRVLSMMKKKVSLDNDGAWRLNLSCRGFN